MPGTECVLQAWAASVHVGLEVRAGTGSPLAKPGKGCPTQGF